MTIADERLQEALGLPGPDEPLWQWIDAMPLTRRASTLTLVEPAPDNILVSKAHPSLLDLFKDEQVELIEMMAPWLKGAQQIVAVAPYSGLVYNIVASFIDSPEFVAFKGDYLTKHPFCAWCRDPATVVWPTSVFAFEVTLIQLGLGWVLRHPECCWGVCQTCWEDICEAEEEYWLERQEDY